METLVTFPGVVAIVPSARRFVRGILGDSPRTDDMELIAAELVTNAIQRSPAGQDGGEFSVAVRTKPGWARVEVSDAGTGHWQPRGTPRAVAKEQYGRGLAIVAALADRFGHDAGAGGQTVWAEITWTETSTA